MKKLLSLITLVAMIFTIAACQQEVEPAENANGDIVEMTINISVPDGLKTKALGDASTITKVDYEIWDSEWTEIVEKNVIELDDNLKGSLTLRLIRFKTYNVLFWAQGEAAKHTWTDLREINIDYTPNIENDAFAGRLCGIDASSDKNLDNAVVLKRPFAQINFATDDLGPGKNVNLGDLTFKSAKVTVPGLAKKYNNVDGVSAGASEAVTFESSAVMAEPFVMNEVSYDYILAFYPLVGEGESATVNLEADFTATCGEEEITVSWTGKGAMNNVPVQANYRTNFYGSIYTAFGDLDVSVDDDFTEVGDPDLNVDSKTIAELLDEATATGSYVIEGNVTAVEANAADDTKEDVTISDNSGELKLTLPKDAVEIVVKAVDTYYHVGDKLKMVVEKTTDGISASEVLDHIRDIAVADGTYWITYNGKYMYPGNESLKYYYGKLEAAGYQDNAFTFKAVNGGYTIQDSYGRYLYQSGTYTSFNVAAELPEAGAVWGVAEAEGGYLITNGEYFVRFSSFGNLDLTKTEADAAVVGLADAKDAKERPILTLSKTTDSVEAEAVEYTLTITSNLAWTAKASEGVTLDKTSGEGNGTITLTFAANTTSSAISHTVTVTAEGVEAQTFTLTQAAGEVDEVSGKSLPYKETFKTDLGEFTVTNISDGGLGKDVFYWYSNYKCLYGNGYGATSATEAYAVSPLIDLREETSAYVSFDHAKGYVDTPSDYFSVVVSEDSKNWTPINVETWPTGWTFVNSGDINISSYCGKQIYVAFKYTSTADTKGAWEIQNLRVGSNATPYITVSETNISVEATATYASFEVSSNYEWTATSDNDDFVVTQSENVVNVAFTANATTEAKTATITIIGLEGVTKTVKITQAGVVAANQTQIVLDVTSGAPEGFPVDSAAGLTTETEYTIDGYVWTFSASTKFYYLTSNKAIIYGKSGSYILLPKVEGKALKSVTAFAPSGASGKVTVGVYDAAGENVIKGGDAVIPTKGDNTTWNLSGTENNTSYQLRITNANNAQFQKLTLIYE